jgi:hypothetical protein
VLLVRSDFGYIFESRTFEFFFIILSLFWSEFFVISFGSAIFWIYFCNDCELFFGRSRVLGLFGVVLL